MNPIPESFWTKEASDARREKFWKWYVEMAGR